MIHFSRSITQYPSHGRFHREIRLFSCRLFSHSSSNKSTKIALFCYLTWFLWFAMAWEQSFMVSISLCIMKCLVTHNKVMNIQAFSDYMLKIFQMWTSRQQNEVMNIVQAKKYPEVPTFWRLFYRPKMTEISYLLSHFSTKCDNIWVNSAEGYMLGAFESALCQSNHFVFSKWLLLNGIWL